MLFYDDIVVRHQLNGHKVDPLGHLVFDPDNCKACAERKKSDLQPPAESDKQSDYVNPYTHIRSLETKLSVAVEALQHYANADAFGQCWHDGEEAKSALSKILPPTE